MTIIKLAITAGVAVGLLSGCQQAGAKHPPQSVLIQQMHQQAKLPDSQTLPAGEATHEQIVQYIVAFKEALKPQLLRWDRYRGKVCTLRISLNRSAKLTGLQQEAGDRALCAATYDAILRTPFPPFANEGLYQTFKNAPLDFAP